MIPRILSMELTVSPLPSPPIARTLFDEKLADALAGVSANLRAESDEVLAETCDGRAMRLTRNFKPSDSDDVPAAMRGKQRRNCYTLTIRDRVLQRIPCRSVFTPLSKVEVIDERVKVCRRFGFEIVAKC